MSVPNDFETEAAEQVARAIESEPIQDRLEGRGDGLRSSKPDTDKDNGLIQYVWRMARFHSGHDSSMPVTAAWWLQDWLDEQGIDASVSGITDEPGKEITSICDEVAEQVLEELGEDPDAGARRWAGLV